ncbi:hypothetical protein D3C85_1376350 [compost metagenome]
MALGMNLVNERKPMPEAPKKWLAINKSSWVLITFDRAMIEFHMPKPAISESALQEKSDLSITTSGRSLLVSL